MSFLLSGFENTCVTMAVYHDLVHKPSFCQELVGSKATVLVIVLLTFVIYTSNLEFPALEKNSYPETVDTFMIS